MSETFEDTIKKNARKAALKSTESAFESMWEFLFEEKISSNFKINHSLEKREVKIRLKNLLRAMPNRITGVWEKDVLQAILIQETFVSKIEISMDIVVTEKDVKVVLHLTCVQKIAKEEIEAGLKKLLKEVLR